jgi:hypothetical protein
MVPTGCNKPAPIPGPGPGLLRATPARQPLDFARFYRRGACRQNRTAPAAASWLFVLYADKKIHRRIESIGTREALSAIRLPSLTRLLESRVGSV